MMPNKDRTIVRPQVPAYWRAVEAQAAAVALAARTQPGIPERMAPEIVAPHGAADTLFSHYFVPEPSFGGPLGFGGVDVPMPIGHAAIPFGEPLRDWARRAPPGATSGDVQGALSAIRFVVAASLWMRQRILTAPTARVERHARKRLKDSVDAAAIRVITLRQLEPAREAGRASRTVEWRCRWIVRGHWRQLYYASLQTHAPRWILPHIKGPGDKPLRLPSARIFKAER